MVSKFGRNTSELCLIFNTALDYIYDSHNHRLLDWNKSMLRQNKLEEYAAAIYDRGKPLSNCFGFVDGTLRPITM